MGYPTNDNNLDFPALPIPPKKKQKPTEDDFPLLEKKSGASVSGGQVGTSVPSSEEDKPIDVSKLRNISSFKGGMSAQDKEDVKNYAIATDKEHKAKVNDAINTTTDIHRAAVKLFTGKENEFQRDVPEEQKGEYVNQFLNNPNVIERAKTDPAFAKQYSETKANWINDYPDAAKKNITQKIGQHLEDNGHTSILFNNPGKDKVDKAVDELSVSGELSPREVDKYKRDIRPDVGTVKSLLFGSPIPTSDYVNTISKSLVRSGGNIAEGMRDAADKISLGTISAVGENRTAHQKRVLNDIYSQPQIESKASEGNKLGLNVADMVGFALPAVLGEFAGVPTMATLGTQFYGQNKKDGMQAFPDNENKQDAYAALTTAIDLMAGEKLPIKGLGQDIRGLVDEAAAGKITQGEAKNKYLEFLNRTFKGTNALEVMKVGHNAANAVFGGSDFNVVDQAKKVLSDYPQDALAMSFFSGIHAATESVGKKATTENPISNEPTTEQQQQPIEATQTAADIQKEITPQENVVSPIEENKVTTPTTEVNEPIKGEAEKTQETPKLKDLQDKKAQLIEQRDNPPTKEVPTFDKYTGKESGKETQPLTEDEVKDHKDKYNAKIDKVDTQIESETKKQDILSKKPQLEDLPFLKAEDFDKAKDSEQMDDLSTKQKEVKQQFKNLRKISECIWAI